jgi:hypothetical protein
MPRIYELDRNATLAEAEADPGTYFLPHDYCRDCWDWAVEDSEEHDEVNTDHPPYRDTDYECDICGTRLTERDD